jgi:hypothetical protein
MCTCNDTVVSVCSRSGCLCTTNCCMPLHPYRQVRNHTLKLRTASVPMVAHCFCADGSSAHHCQQNMYIQLVYS